MSDDGLTCSFCGKGRKDVPALITGFVPDGPVAVICNECVGASQRMIEERLIERALKAEDALRSASLSAPPSKKEGER